jgi:hypothetical protein
MWSILDISIGSYLFGWRIFLDSPDLRRFFLVIIKGKIPGNLASIAVYYFMIGFGAASSYMACIGVNAENFTVKKQGLVVGLQLLFYGLSGSFFSMLFYIGFSYNENYSGYFSMLAYCCFVVNGTFFILIDKLLA